MHCQLTTQVLSGLQNELGPKGFQAIESAINENPDVPGFVRQFKPAFPVGASEATDARGFLQIPLFTQAYVPLMAIIDRSGKIREQHTGSEREFFSDDFKVQTDNLRAAIEKYLAEPAKGPKKQKRRRAGH